ncbi:UDP-glucose/GDP-mannose dehydrogenase family protein [Paenibacillus tarimensis]
MSKNKITVIGTGYVGLVCGACFAEKGYEVTSCDIDEAKIERLNSGEVPIYEPGLQPMIRDNVRAGRLTFTANVEEAIRRSEIVYIAVGTPMSASGEADLAGVLSVARTIGEHLNGYKVIVTKSTVPVGTGKVIEETISRYRMDPEVRFDVVANPEFLREGTAIQDCMQMERAVIGSRSEEAASIIAELHKPFNTNIVITSLESAEMIKYAANAFLATKVAFINGVANLCEAFGADVTEVAEGMGLDSRIGRRFLQAGIGYGGSCFPKDMLALQSSSQQAGYDFPLLGAVMEMNERQKVIFIDKIKQVIGDINGKTIAVLGLAFKPDTDDIRCAPSLTIVPALHQMGATIKAFDPAANVNFRQQVGQDVQYFTDVYETILNCDAAVILTEWQEITRMDLAKARVLMKSPVLFDGRNCFSLEEMNRSGFAYYPVGRAAVSQLPKQDETSDL